MVITVLLFVLGLIFICVGGDRLVDAAVAIAEKLKISQIVVGATIVSLGTTLPEILVSTTAAFDGSSAVAAGNAFGSVICNTALIAGITQTIRPAGKTAAAIGWRGSFFFAVAAVMEIWGVMTGAFNRFIGMCLIAAFGFYAYMNIKSASGGQEEEEDAGQVSMPKQILVLVACALFLYAGAKLLVDNGILIAQALSVPERVIAVTFIALGTSLPELVTSMMSLVKGYGNVGLGNIIGANTLNLLLVIGIPAAVTGIPLEKQTTGLDIPLAILVMAVLVVPTLIRKRSSRAQGIVLLGIYAAYCIVSFAGLQLP